MGNKHKLVKRRKTCSYRASAAHMNDTIRKRHRRIIDSEHDEIILSRNENCGTPSHESETRAPNKDPSLVDIDETTDSPKHEQEEVNFSIQIERCTPDNRLRKKIAKKRRRASHD